MTVFLTYIITLEAEETCKAIKDLFTPQGLSCGGLWTRVVQNHKVMSYMRVNARNKFYNLQTEQELVGDMTFHQTGERWVAQML